MSKFKHLTLNERKEIEYALNQGASLKSIAAMLKRSTSSISREIKRNATVTKTGSFKNIYNPCVYRFKCQKEHACAEVDCDERFCRNCRRCNSVCTDYVKENCDKLKKTPYVCNNCNQRHNCTKEKFFYKAKKANKTYDDTLKDTRSGISIDSRELERIDDIVSPLIKQGQSIHNIVENNKDKIMCDEKTIYNYFELGLFTAKNIDLPRKVKMKPRKTKKVIKIDRACRKGRTYEDFLRFIEEHPDTSVVEMDSVEGSKGGKVLLTLFFRESMLMPAFIRDSNTARSVKVIFDHLYRTLGRKAFLKLFPVILTDNGSEFSDPNALEFDSKGKRRTRIFYCDPYASFQKNGIETNHSLIRRIVPKGKTFDIYSQQQINIMMSQINSYSRKKLNDKSPWESFSFFHNSLILKKFGLTFIPHKDIVLNPKLLR